MQKLSERFEIFIRKDINLNIYTYWLFLENSFLIAVIDFCLGSKKFHSMTNVKLGEHIFSHICLMTSNPKKIVEINHIPYRSIILYWVDLVSCIAGSWYPIPFWANCIGLQTLRNNLCRIGIEFMTKHFATTTLTIDLEQQLF